jgi:hypothetical protein
MQQRHKKTAQLDHPLAAFSENSHKKLITPCLSARGRGPEIRSTHNNQSSELRQLQLLEEENFKGTMISGLPTRLCLARRPS